MIRYRWCCSRLFIKVLFVVWFRKVTHGPILPSGLLYFTSPSHCSLPQLYSTNNQTVTCLTSLLQLHSLAYWYFVIAKELEIPSVTVFSASLSRLIRYPNQPLLFEIRELGAEADAQWRMIQVRACLNLWRTFLKLRMIGPDGGFYWKLDGSCGGLSQLVCLH